MFLKGNKCNIEHSGVNAVVLVLTIQDVVVDIQLNDGAFRSFATNVKQGVKFKKENQSRRLVCKK